MVVTPPAKMVMTDQPLTAERMAWLKLVNLILLGCLLGRQALAAEFQPPPSHLFVGERIYVLDLHQNHRLAGQLRHSHEAAVSRKSVGMHYQGQLLDGHNGWLRLSQIDGRWQGLASVEGEVYAVAMNERSLLTGIPLTTTPVPVCAAEQAQAQHDVMGAAVHPATLVAEEVQFARLCSSTVDGICLLAEMEFAFDQQFQQEFGAQSAAQALALVNIVEGFYRNDLNIAFDTLTLELLDSTIFSTTTDPGDLLEDVRSQRQSNSLPFLQNTLSLFHLVTGRDFNGSTAGTAFVDVLCGSSGIGTSQLVRDFDSTPDIPLTGLVIAHEMGHNFGARHDGDGNSCGGNFIMASSVNAAANNFSSCSQLAIRNAISSLNRPTNCFNYPATLSISAIANNPLQVELGSIFTLDYQIDSQTAFLSIPTLSASGSVPASQGQYIAATLGGQGCSIASDRLSFNCSLGNPAAGVALEIQATGQVGTAIFTHQVGIAGTVDLVDGDTTDNTAVASVVITPVPTPRPVAASSLVLLLQSESTQVSVSWQDNSDNESGFRLERNTNNSGFELIEVLGSNSTQYLDTDTVAGAAYQYRVFAFNDNGDAVVSNVARITPALRSEVSNATFASSSSGGGSATSWPALLILLLLVAQRNVCGVKETL